MISYKSSVPRDWGRDWGSCAAESGSPGSPYRTSVGTDECTWWSPASSYRSANRHKERDEINLVSGVYFILLSWTAFSKFQQQGTGRSNGQKAQNQNQSQSRRTGLQLAFQEECCISPINTFQFICFLCKHFKSSPSQKPSEAAFWQSTELKAPPTQCFYFGGDPSHLVVGHLQQVQHDFMSSHVLQQPLLLLPNSTAAHLIQPLQDLQKEDFKHSLLPGEQVSLCS